MIGKLTGKIESVDGNEMILDVGGVGYVVMASAQTLAAVGGAGSPVSLLIETQVREDAINLYGFVNRAEKEAFRLLLTVQGVGAKVALSILSLFTPARLGEILAAADKTALVRADGVGPKLALRLLTELKDKAPAFGGAFVPPSGKGIISAAPAPLAGAREEAVSALVNLGYGRTDAFMAVNEAALKAGEGAALPVLLRAALALLGKEK